MAIVPFLAMTATEMRNSFAFPPKVAWMACHFSPYGLGLSNLPKELPAGTLLMVDDITPPCGQDPGLIAEQLTNCIQTLHCSSILLDFQRAGSEEARTLANHLMQALPCPVVVSECYSGDFEGPVFLPPVPPSVPLAEYLLPWKGRELWIELGLDGEILTLTEKGCETIPLPCPDLEADGFSDEKLHCHYTIETTEQSAGFTLWRTTNDLVELLAEAAELGVVEAVGLYQELGKFAPHKSLHCVRGGAPRSESK